MRRIFGAGLLLSLIFLLSFPLFAQHMQPTLLIDTPTAGTLDRGSYTVGLRLYPYGGVLGSISVGLSARATFGVSFGGENIIGEGNVHWNPAPGVHVRYRIIDENIVLPAVTVGFNSQGYGAYLKDLKRYMVKSRGFFVVASKNYAFLGDLSFHGGANYSLETHDGDSDLNFFAGVIKSLNPDLWFVAEYDFAINDNEDNSLGSGKGYLNAALRWIFAKQLYVQFSLKNILENKKNIPYANREIKIVYQEHF